MSKSILLVWVILFMLVPILGFSHSRQVTSTITASKGDPLPFVYGIQKGTKNGTSANNAGRFPVTVYDNNAVLVTSSLGYASQELQLGSANDYTVSLSNAVSLDEVIVTAVGICRIQKSVGYSTQQVKGENHKITKEQNVVGSLAGKICGVQIVGGSGASLGGKQKNQDPWSKFFNRQQSTFGSSIGNRPDLGNLAQDVNPVDN